MKHWISEMTKQNISSDTMQHKITIYTTNQCYTMPKSCNICQIWHFQIRFLHSSRSKHTWGFFIAKIPMKEGPSSSMPNSPISIQVFVTRRHMKNQQPENHNTDCSCQQWKQLMTWYFTWIQCTVQIYCVVEADHKRIFLLWPKNKKYRKSNFIYGRKIKENKKDPTFSAENEK